MKKLLFLSLLFFALPLMAKEIETDTVVLQAMDKITGRVKKITMSVGQQISFEEILISVDKCFTKSPEEAPENTAFLRIISKEDNKKELFKGWMFSSNPALSAMEDPEYDIWVVSCYNKEVEVSKPESELIVQEPVLEEPEEVLDPNEEIED